MFHLLASPIKRARAAAQREVDQLREPYGFTTPIDEQPWLAPTAPMVDFSAITQLPSHVRQLANAALWKVMNPPETEGTGSWRETALAGAAKRGAQFSSDCAKGVWARLIIRNATEEHSTIAAASSGIASARHLTRELSSSAGHLSTAAYVRATK